MTIRRSVCRVLATGVALGLASGTAIGQPPRPSGFEMERVSWVGEVAEGQRITVHNAFGDVRARFGGYAGQVELLAHVQHFAEEGTRLEVATEVVASGLDVTVGYRTNSGAVATVREPAHKKRVDLVIYIPDEATLRVSTEDGLVDVRGLRSDVHGRTVGGAIRVRTVQGTLDLASATGDVVALLEAWDAVRHHTLASDHGALSVVFAGEVNAAIQVATSGLVSTDFSMRLDYQVDRHPVRKGEALAGKGSSSVSVRSDDGQIRISAKPLGVRRGAGSMRTRHVVLATGLPVPGNPGVANGADLWRQPVSAGGCRVSLENELGGVQVGPGPAEGAPAIVVHGVPELEITAADAAFAGPC